MRIGIDFDNTIICYDDLFDRVARDAGLIPSGFTGTKSSIRNLLRSQGEEQKWTELQGTVYGSAIVDAKPFPGLLDFLKTALSLDHSLFIVSHKTLWPFAGEKHNLHEAAHGWIKQIGLSEILGEDGVQKIFFELTLEEKLQRIDALGCDVFIDDLPEVLQNTLFPSGTRKFLFDPQNQYSTTDVIDRASSWKNISTSLLGTS